MSWFRFVMVDIVLPAVIAVVAVVVYDAMVHEDYEKGDDDESYG